MHGLWTRWEPLPEGRGQTEHAVLGNRALLHLTADFSDPGAWPLLELPLAVPQVGFLEMICPAFLKLSRPCPHPSLHWMSSPACPGIWNEKDFAPFGDLHILRDASMPWAWSPWCLTLCMTALLQAVFTLSKDPLPRTVNESVHSLWGPDGLRQRGPEGPPRKIWQWWGQEAGEGM